MHPLLRALPLEAIAVQVLAEDRTEAIRLAGDLLVATGRTTADYTTEMLAAIDQFGPYIVIAPGIAIAHSRPSPAVLDTGFSLVVLEEALHFGSEINDPVRLVFALAAKDHDGHIDALGMLGELLSDQGFVNFLLNSSRSEDIRLELELRTGTIE